MPNKTSCAAIDRNISASPQDDAPVPFPKAISLVGCLHDFFRAMYDYREYLKQSVARDLRKQYKRSVLGYFWSMLHPLLMMAILAVVFSNLMRQPARTYAVFLLTGMLPFDYFSGSISQSLTAIRANISIISQIPVPKYVFPLAITLSHLSTFMLSIVALLVVILCAGAPFHWTMLALPIVILPLFLFTIGACLLFAVSNVFFEDTQHLTGVILRALYFLCPILYAREHLPDWLRPWLVLNPLFGLIEFMHDLFVRGVLPAWDIYAIHLGAALAVLILGLWVFKKTEDKFIYFV
jgi:ABC-type polysaccharide/polyol phosphate export permease